MEKEKFTLLLMKDAEDFLRSIPDNVKDKIYYNIYKIQMGERDSEIFKKLGESDIWEFRTLYDKKAYRLFAFWDTEEDTLVIATHGIVKKTQKTPPKEIAKAEALRNEYFNDKEK